MKGRLLALVALFLVTSGLGCESDGDRVIVEEPILRVNGTVRDSVSNTVVESVRVVLDSTLEVARSDSTGTYSARVGYDLDHWLSFEKAGYRAKSAFLAEAAEPESATITVYRLDVEMSPIVVIGGLQAPH